MAYRLTDPLRTRWAAVFPLEVLRGVKKEYPASNYFDTWYYAMRYVRTNALSSLVSLLSGSQPATRRDASSAFGCSQVQALFKKRSDLDHGIDRAAAAAESFILSEALCRDMNRKLRDESDPEFRARATLISQISRKITQILGPVPDPERLRCGFGPGQNVGCSQNTNATSKLLADATTTVDALYLLRDVLGTSNTAWRGLNRLTIVDAARFTTVPKTWKIDRGIMVEPIVNTFLQKGIGSHLRSRLRLFGCNLSDQSINQSRALQGSRAGTYATIDLSMASDTISANLVLDLLPLPWFDLLYSARSHRAVMPGGTVLELEKFSSMGNGYTFELESLIFYATAKVVAGEDVSVYGDDIIVPSDRYAQMLTALRLLGFVPNDAKSFGSGPFRESCGGDYFGGVNVRPIFFTTSPTHMDLIRLWNWSMSTGRLALLRSWIVRALPRGLRLYGPAGFGDTYLHNAYTRAPLVNDKRGFGAFRRFKLWIPKQRVTPVDDYGDLLGFLYWRTYRNLGDITFESVGRNVRSFNPSYRKITLTAYCSI